MFQAIRIAVNDELKVFEEALEQAIESLNPKEEEFLSLHSIHLKTGFVLKSTFREMSSLPELPHGLPVIPEGLEPKLKLITRKPIVASEQELEHNNRARSAKLRIAEKK